MASIFTVVPQTNLPPGVNPQLVQYAMRVFGSTDLTDDQWRQCEDQQKVFESWNLLHLRYETISVSAWFT
jgi:hypothetical protein